MASRRRPGESRMTEPHHLPAPPWCCMDRCTTDRRQEDECNSNMSRDEKGTLRNKGHATIRAPGTSRVWTPWGPQAMMSSCAGSIHSRAAPWNREAGSVKRDRRCLMGEGCEGCGWYNFQVMCPRCRNALLSVCAGRLSAAFGVEK